MLVVLFDILDIIVFVVMAIYVVYIFVFSLFSLNGWKTRYERCSGGRKMRFAVLVPAYKEDNVIFDTIANLLLQDYSRNLYDVVVISDGMSDATNGRLLKLPVITLKPIFDKSSKAEALKYAASYLDKNSGTGYDAVIILDADNIVESCFLSDIADAFCKGVKALQVHRVSKNRENSVAVLDALSEEINNSIFRKGHIYAGFSSALIGSGMAFDYGWFIENVKKLKTAGEDKELEALLLKQRIFIDYLDYDYIYDQKVSGYDAFYGQRRRWVAAQFGSLSHFFSEFIYALKTANYDYMEKLFQWMILPRVVILGIILIMSVAAPLVTFSLGWKWWIMLFLFLLSLAISTPDYLVDEKFRRAMKRIPAIFLMMFSNLFRTSGANENFIHTEHK